MSLLTLSIPVFGLLLVVVLLADAAPTTTGQRRTLRIPLGTIPAGEDSHWASPLDQLQLQLPHFQEEKTANGGVTTAFDKPHHIFVGNISVGSPAQTVLVRFSPYKSDFVFLDAYGPDLSSSSNTDAKAGRYDYTASTTAVSNNQSFFALYGSISGNITVTDTIQFNGLSASDLTFGVAGTYDNEVAQVGVGGIIGLSNYPNTRDTNITSFGSQLAASSSFDSPVASLNFVLYSLNKSSNAWNTSGQVTVGAEDDDACTAGGYTYVPVAANTTAYFRVDSISGQTPSGDTVSLTLNANRSTSIMPTPLPFYGSTDFVQLMVNVSGLTLVDPGSGYYEAASCDDVQNMGSLTLNLAGGSTLTISPADYIVHNVTSDGSTKCGAYLRAGGQGYAETDPDHSTSIIILGQSYVNNHCYAHNYVDGTIGIGNARTPTPIVVTV